LVSEDLPLAGGADIRQPADYINFFDDKSGQAKQVIVQVKSPSADGLAWTTSAT
jgi:hypothetical protein